jgi:DNA-binding NarL/FixJ family response regulator
MLDVTVRLLERDHEVVATAVDGAAVLDAVAALRPDVVVLDISMPGLTGIEAARRLKASGSNARIVFLTVHKDPHIAAESFAVGGSAFVTKSRVTTDLRLAISEALAGRTFVSPSSTSNSPPSAFLR